MLHFFFVRSPTIRHPCPPRATLGTGAPAPIAPTWSKFRNARRAIDVGTHRFLADVDTFKDFLPSHFFNLKFNFRNSMRRCFGKENVPLAWTEHTLQGTHEIWNALFSHQRRVFGVTPRLHNAKADPSAGAKALITKFTTQSSKLALSLSWKLKTQNMFSYVFRVGQGLCTVKHV